MYKPSMTVQDVKSTALNHLKTYAADIHADPQVNSVKKVAYDFSDALINGKLTQDQLASLVRNIANEGFDRRVENLTSYHNSQAHTLVLDRLKDLAEHGFPAYKAALTKLKSGIVFTAHPTFAMPSALRQNLIDRASGVSSMDSGYDGPHLPDHKVDLSAEHDIILDAIDCASGAVRRFNASVINLTAELFPEDWRKLCPELISVATWVGYDLDGRTDIHWAKSIAFKLEEKARQLTYYAQKMSVLGDDFDSETKFLKTAASHVYDQLKAFQGDLEDPEQVVRAANLLTDDHAAKIISLTDYITRLRKAALDLDADTAKKCLLLASEMKILGLGVARIHLRVNAAQVRGAVKADLDIDEGVKDFGRVALLRAAERAMATKSYRINFANVFTEKMTARRQFMVCAQILKHIDSDSPIRFLIAECERPATVMGAIYLARLYGVADKLDISPLFETPSALERGGRFMEQLLDEQAYLTYARTRGHLAIQIGYSDSGRFMGQIAAELAAERLQILLARALGERNIRDVTVILFNTHGESMGRGAHPKSFQDRMNHLFTPWAKDRYNQENVALIHETSFQGGDGVVHFGNDIMADRTVANIMCHALSEPKRQPQDPFYGQISFTWDVYRSLKAWQEKLFDDMDYRLSLSAFATQFLVKTGSRKAKRQSATEGDLSKVRAIPNNAALQQLAIPANVTGGLGTAARSESDRFLEVIDQSPRASAVVSLAARARALTSLPVLRAYAGLYDASFWVARAACAEGVDQLALIDIASELKEQRISQSLTRLANHLSADMIYLDDILDQSGLGISRAERYKQRLPLHLLHACRMALIMQAFILIARLPAFSRRHDVTRSDLIDMVIHLRLTEAVDVLDLVFPNEIEGAETLSGMNEKADDSAAMDHGYPGVQRDVVRPLADLIPLVEEISVALSHFYSAWG